ncbi:MAG: alkaline phosphatase family protein [Propionibacteriaceae bacterium]|nr:alkaline phosphatase family protein [Propionibacteriaceae bacterium]
MPGLTGVIADAAAHLGTHSSVLLLIDGLGSFNLDDDPSLAPTMASLPRTDLMTGLPSTTSASITCLLTGVDTAQHGLVGFAFRTRPGFAMNTMLWDDPSFIPETAQPVPTWFERLGAQGIPTAVVVPSVFANSGLTRAILRGADFVGIEHENDWEEQTALVADAVKTHPLTYVYARSLDHAGHARGWRSSAWRRQLRRIDGFVGQLLETLPTGTTLTITGDHGMVDVAPTHKVLIDDEPELAQDIDLVAGEARFRYLYTTEPEAVATRWAKWWGGRADVFTREQALPLFGATPPTPDVATRFGDVVVALHDDWVALTSSRPREAQMIGMHGSLTDQERLVPLLKGMV